jgi:hypothetical protein
LLIRDKENTRKLENYISGEGVQPLREKEFPSKDCGVFKQTMQGINQIFLELIAL